MLNFQKLDDLRVNPFYDLRSGEMETLATLPVFYALRYAFLYGYMRGGNATKKALAGVRGTCKGSPKSTNQKPKGAKTL